MHVSLNTHIWSVQNAKSCILLQQTHHSENPAEKPEGKRHTFASLLEMSRVISNATIIQVQSQSLIFRTCAKCSGKVTTIAHIYKDKTTDVLWCDKCNDRVQDCKATYKLDLYICQDDTDSIQAIKAYDKALEPVLGCDAQRFMKVN